MFRKFENDYFGQCGSIILSAFEENNSGCGVEDGRRQKCVHVDLEGGTAVARV